jgi:hypothetical protein
METRAFSGDTEMSEKEITHEAKQERAKMAVDLRFLPA